MKDFAKSIVCNTKAEVENFEDKEKAKSYIQTWERRRDNAKRALQNSEAHLKEAMKHRFGDKDFQQREIKRYQDEIKAAEAEVRQYDDLIKSASKSTFGNSKCGNSVTEKEFNTEADLRRWCMDHNYTYTPVGGGYYRLEDDKPGRNRPDLYAHVKAGNKKVGNATIKFYGETIDLTKESESYLKEILEEMQMMHEQSDAQRAIKEELNKRKTGNSKVGNADKFSGNYIIMSDDGDVWFRDEHEDVSIRSIDSWAQKRIAEYQRSINEIQKGVQEAKQAAKKFGLL